MDREPGTTVPFWVSVRGEVDAANAAKLYQRLLEVARTAGELSSTQAVSIVFGEGIGSDLQPGEFVDVPVPGVIPLELAPEELKGHLIELGAYLKGHRKEQSLTQMYVARMAGVGQTYLSQLELGQRNSRPEAAALISIAGLLGLDPKEVLRRAAYKVLEDADD